MMNLILSEIPKKLNKAYLKQDLNREKVEVFKSNLKILFSKAEIAENKKEHEEHFKNIVSDFLKDTWYKNNFEININKRKDLVIHNGKSSSDSVAVIIEAKKPSNETEMISSKAPNAKALHELIHYYLHERIINNNKEIKHIIATNNYDWFIFDAADFEKHFYENKSVRKSYEEWHSGTSLNSNTNWFYTQIAKPYIETELKELEAVHFNLLDYKQIIENSNPADDDKLINLYKVLSPEHLLKKPFANDSNSLNKEFYNELLHIIGLEEKPDGGKKLIDRKKPEKRDEGSLLENTIRIIESRNRQIKFSVNQHKDSTPDDETFSIALELCITWLNRILFLKLLEGQLIKYHNGNTDYAFINSRKIKDFDELDELFFEVLAINIKDRTQSVNEKYGNIPYLNSSLFEPSELEQNYTFINSLKDRLELPIYSHSVLKNKEENKVLQKKLTLHYLFEFLEAYNFSSDSSAKIQEDNKTIINASVLGLIFEKINGYKDGSFFTPGFITMYMCRETIRRAVIQKFNDTALLSHPKLEIVPKVPHPQSLSNLEKEAKSKVKTVETNLPPQLLKFAREMRKNQTDAEELLWQLLRNRQLNNWKFRRQHPMSEGFILDFYCSETRIAIELDGDYHNDKAQQEYDSERSLLLEKYGIKVIRFKNNEVLNETEKVLEKIAEFSYDITTLENGEISEISASIHLESVINKTSPPAPLQNGEGSQKNTDIGNKFTSLHDVREAIGIQFSRKEANDLINSLKICDPAVGSGHFLVSALNEIIAIKSELDVLCYQNGNRIKDYKIVVDNDELVITDKQTEEIFQYHLNEKGKPIDYLQELQETLFHEKQTIIENCLFGVDINPKSVLICRLRLWIELLKNSYYKTTEIAAGSSSPLQIGEGPGVRSLALETLPNIDINIKCGNSLISRFPLDIDLSKALKSIKYDINTYRKCVADYKNATDKDDKHALELLINQIKTDFRDQINSNDPKLLRLNKLSGELWAHTNQVQIFEQSLAQKAEFNKKAEKLATEKTKLEQEIAEIKNNVIYRNAFEWRFEFPEVLDDEGNFLGFDVVIGNPPYIRQEEISNFKPYLQERYPSYIGTADLYVYFIDLGTRILRSKGNFTFILPNKWMRAGYGKSLRNNILKQNIESIIDFGDLPVFDEATTYPCILSFSNNKSTEKFTAANIKSLNFPNGLSTYVEENKIIIDENELQESGWSLNDSKTQKLLSKIKNSGIPLGEYVKNKIFRGVLTGLNEAFVINSDKRNELIAKDANSAKLIKPFLAGKDIKRFHQPQNKDWLIMIPKGFTIKRNLPINSPYYLEEPMRRYGSMEDDPAWEWFSKYYPAIAAHLLEFKDKAAKRTDKGDFWWELRACEYYDEFDKMKIVWPETSLDNQFTFIDKGIYLNKTSFFIPLENYELLGLLNSKVVKYFLNSIVSKMRGGYFSLSKAYVETTPIPKFLNESKIGSLVKDILKLKKQNPNYDTTHLENQIDQLVYQLYGLTEEEIKIVEGA